MADDGIKLTDDEREALWQSGEVSIINTDHDSNLVAAVESIVAAGVQALTAELGELRKQYRLDHAERDLNRRERDAARAELAAANTRIAELEKRIEDDMRIRLNVEKVLDLALGTEAVDGAGNGLAADVHLLAARWSAALDRTDALSARIERAQAMLPPDGVGIRGSASASWVRDLRAALGEDA